ATERMSIAQSRMVQAQMAGDEALVAFYQRMLEQAQIDYLTLITQLGVTSSPARPWKPLFDNDGDAFNEQPDDKACGSGQSTGLPYKLNRVRKEADKPIAYARKILDHT